MNEPVNLPPEITDSYHYAVLYIAPKSKKWPTLKQLLQTKVKTFENGVNFIALFQATRPDFEVLYSAMLISSGWKTAYYFYKGKPVSSNQVWYPVGCINAMGGMAGKPEACVAEAPVYDDMTNGKTEMRVFTVPCKVIASQWYRHQTGENYFDQFMACAQKWGSTMCPFFKPEPFEGPRFEKCHPNMNISLTVTERLITEIIKSESVDTDRNVDDKVVMKAINSKHFSNPEAQKKYADAIRLGVKVGTWVHIPGPKYLCHTHIKLEGKPFLLSEGLYDEDVGRNILPGELEGCSCTFRNFLPLFGDVATPEIESLLEKEKQKE